VVEVETSIAPLAEAWDDLADRVEGCPFLRPQWTAAWWRAFGQGRLSVLTARRDGRLVGILPTYRWRGVVRSMTNRHSPEFGMLVEDASAARDLANALLSRRHGAVSLHLLTQGGLELEQCLVAAESTGHRLLIQTTVRSPYVAIESEWKNFEKTLSRNIRHDVSRRQRRLYQQGSTSIEVADGTERLDDLLEQGFRVEASGWKGSKRTAIASSPDTRQFYTDVARWAAARGWLRLAFLRLDGRAIAFQFDLEANERYYSLKTGYDPDYETFSPGKILAHTMLARAFSARLASYEFLGTDETWKFRWTGTVRDRVKFQAFPRSPIGFLMWATVINRRPVGKRAGWLRRLRI
jgi:CelD/BcsL family acetyltransferase involved in cellulose biosynthesis